MKNFIYYTRFYLLLLTIVILILDFGSKQLILNNFKLYESVQLITYFNLYYVQNTGVAFSFMADISEWNRWFFSFISIIICIVLIFIMYRQNINKKLINISYSFVIGGALGNISDRLIHGFVVDFIDFHVGIYHWPTFNIADMSICVGALLIVLDSFINTDKK
ncbi:MAG: signal peptidase II [Arsenophonus sp.]